MSPITRLASAMVTACLVAGCSGGVSPAPVAPTTAAPETIAPVARPHFVGARPVTLQVGQVAYAGDPCQGLDTSGRVCDADGRREYLLFGDPGAARVIEARMDPTAGNTAWDATVVFSRGSGPDLRAFREQARSTGGLLLVLDETGSTLLVAAPVPRVEGRRITLRELRKPEAWALVERITEG